MLTALKALILLGFFNRGDRIRTLNPMSFKSSKERGFEHPFPEILTRFLTNKHLLIYQFYKTQLSIIENKDYIITLPLFDKVFNDFFIFP